MFPFATTIELLNVVFEDPIEFWSYDKLAAPYWRLYSNTTPGARVEYCGETTVLEPGAGYLIPPETSFDARFDQPFGHLYLHFLVGEPYASLTPGIYPFAWSAEEQVLAARVQQEFLSTRDEGVLLPRELDPRVAALSAAWSQQLVWAALVHFSADLPVRPTYDLRVEQVIRLLDAASDRAPTNQELADQVALHPDSLIRLFRQQTGDTPAKWSLRRRIDRACVLLAHTDRTIKDIAGACGFPDRQRGKAPALWRREQASP